MTTHSDRRIQRTQEALRQAFIELIIEKGFAATSIRDITARANVNRGTFYIHFADKYAMFNFVSRNAFREQLMARLPDQAQYSRDNLHLLIRLVLESFESKYDHQRILSPFMAEMAPMLERATREELAHLLRNWLMNETTASIVAWAIFGAALQWSQEPVTIPLEDMACKILTVVMDGLPK